ncbi:hypothetical protein ABIB62_000653 [Mucilaginibacter sp. UYP25]
MQPLAYYLDEESALAAVLRKTKKAAKTTRPFGVLNIN